MDKAKKVGELTTDINMIDIMIKTCVDYENYELDHTDEAMILKWAKNGQIRKYLQEYREYLSSLEVKIH